MHLATTYLGLPLPHPFMCGASPLVDDFDMVRRLEDAGSAAIVMHSLFEEQIARDALETLEELEEHSDSFPEALSYFPKNDEFALGPEEYLEQIRRIKAMVSVPVIGSLNGTTAEGWLKYARLIEQAGADALELNVYYFASDQHESSGAVENRVIRIVRSVKQSVAIPIAVKLSPFYSSITHLAHHLDRLQADGLVLFNRFYQPDIDIETLEVVPSLRLSDSTELLLRLRWVGILFGHLRASLAVTGGVQSAEDAIKALMAGADVVQMVSCLLRHGPEYLHQVRKDVVQWMEEHEYESIAQMRGNMSLRHCPDPAAFERGNYMRILQQSWTVPGRAF